MKFGMICIFLLSICSVMGSGWKEYQVSYEDDPELKNANISMNWKKKKVVFNGSNTCKIYIPDDLKSDEKIRGIIAKEKGFMEFAHKNRIAMYDKTGNLPYGGPHKTMLQAAAKLTGHPEIEHAGAILYGTSNLGRFAAHFAYFFPHRTLAVILDHSWGTGSPATSISTYDYGQTPAAKGVPYFFNSAQKDAHQGFNRRAIHYSWCTKAFKGDYPCTSIISWEDVGHGSAGDRALQGAWLEDVMRLRLPAIIPDNKPYDLLEIDPSKDGGHIKLDMKTQGLVSHYTKISAGPIGSIRGASFWLPGAKSASLALEWLQKNKGAIVLDLTEDIIVLPKFETLDKNNEKIYKLLKSGLYNKAYAAVKLIKEPTDAEQQQALASIKENLKAGVLQEIGRLKGLLELGDLHQLKLSIKAKSKLFKGITPYDELVKKCGAEFLKTENKTIIIAGKLFNLYLGKLVKKRSKANITWFNKFAAKYPETLYGKMAAALYQKLEQDPNASLSLKQLRQAAQ